MLTALVATRHLRLSDTLTVPRTTLVGGARSGLRHGERLTVRTMLYDMMLRSSSDATAALALATPGSLRAFSALMQHEARKLHLNRGPSRWRVGRLAYLARE
jgi:D-alanyl-D-alanine carboxypeptidase